MPATHRGTVGVAEDVPRADVLRVLQSKEEIRAYYNKISGVYDRLAERSEAPVREEALRLLDPWPGERLLEIGFGPGHSLVEMAHRVKPGGRVHGVDISDGMCDHALELLTREACRDTVELHRADAVDLPFEDHSIDGVFMSFTLEIFDTPEIPKVLAGCLRVLRAGGRLVVVSVSRTEPANPMVRVFEWTHRHFPNLLDCRPIYARQAVEAAGFEIITSAVRHMWVPVEVVLSRVPPLVQLLRDPMHHPAADALSAR